MRLVKECNVIRLDEKTGNWWRFPQAWFTQNNLLHPCCALFDLGGEDFFRLSSAVSVWIASLTQPRLGKETFFLNGFPAFVLGVEPIPVSLVDDAESPIARLQPKLSLWLKQAPDGNGVRLWKNRVDRIQDPVKGLSLTRWILASGGLRRLRPILSFHLLPLSLSLSSVSLHTGGGNFQQPLFIYQLITIPPRTSIPLRIFYLKTMAKADVIWSLLCPQVLRDC